MIIIKFILNNKSIPEHSSDSRIHLQVYPPYKYLQYFCHNLGPFAYISFFNISSQLSCIRIIKQNLIGIISDKHVPSEEPPSLLNGYLNSISRLWSWTIDFNNILTILGAIGEHQTIPEYFLWLHSIISKHLLQRTIYYISSNF